MRTYSHAILTYTALRLTNRTRREATIAALGATLPDLPAGLGAAWLWTKKRSTSREDFDREVCGRSEFRIPDAAAHSLVVLMSVLPLLRNSRSDRAFLVGWAGHLVVDLLTHSSDARQQLWPLSEWRFRSPVSYRERGRYGRAFSFVEHGFVLAAIVTAAKSRRAF